ncbi:LysR substrate-binding domain-containing protein, partial [Frigoribacterium salinisoli]
GSGTRRTLELALGIDPALMAEPAAQLSSTGAIRAAIAGGVGPGVISSLLVEDDLRAGRLVTVPTAVDLRRPFRAVWSASPSAGARDLLAVIATLQHSPHSSAR